MGLNFTPCFSNEEEREKFVDSLIPQKETFELWNNDIETSTNTMIEKMKWFIFKNWKKLSIDNWNEINVTINKKQYGYKHDLRDTGEPFDVPYTDKKGRLCYRSKVMEKVFKRHNEETTTIEKINFVFDTFDGDLSLGFEEDQNKNWAFLTDEQIIEIAIHMERTLNKKNG